jgi:hypothetical protein
MNPFDHMLSDSAPWRELSDLLERAGDSLPPASWRPTIHTVEARNQEDQKYLHDALWEILKDHVPEVQSALLHWHTDGEWPELSPQAVFHLRLIHSRCLIHLASIAGVRDTEIETAFAFPDGHLVDVALWMTMFWWTECGFPWFLQELSRRSSRLPYDIAEI